MNKDNIVLANSWMQGFLPVTGLHLRDNGPWMKWMRVGTVPAGRVFVKRRHC